LIIFVALLADFKVGLSEFNQITKIGKELSFYKKENLLQ
jgi:hypothetical protein